MTKDFFISYNSADATWAEWIAWVLEENGYTVTIQAWDFRPGGNFILDMQRAAQNCDRTIAVLSDDYLNALYTQPEWAAAFKQDPTSTKRKLLPIRVAPCEPTGLLAPLVYVDLVGQSEAEAEPLLLGALQERGKPDTRPSFPQSVPQPERVTADTVAFPQNIPRQSARTKLTPTGNTLLNNLQDRGIDPQRFVGREAALNRLHDCLANHRKVVTVGMFGLGKTELAIQYARTYTADYPGGVGWFAADRFAAELSGWIQAKLYGECDLRHLDLAQQVTVAWEEWHKFCAQRPALVIVDDVTDYGQQVAPYLPPNDDTAAPFRFVFTSRSDIPTLQTFALPQLALPDALQLLERLAGKARIQADVATAETVCNRLGSLPLALTLMGSWLNVDPDRTVADLSRALDQQGLDTPALDRNLDDVLTAERGVKAAFAVSWAQLNQRSTDAAQLARVLTLFVPVDLPWTLIEAVIETYAQKYGLTTPLAPVAQPESMRWLRQLWGKRTPPAHPSPPQVYPVNAPLEARGHLLRLNLLECVRQENADPEPPQVTEAGIPPVVASFLNNEGWGGSAVYRLHPLLRELFAEQWPGFDREHWVLAFALGIAAEAEQVPKQVDVETANQFAPLKAHFALAESILKEQQQATAVTIPSDAEHYKVAAGKLSTANFRLSHRVMFALRFEQAQKIYDEAKAAAVAGQQGLASQKFAEAIEYYQEVVEYARRALPPHSLPLASYLNRLAQIFRDLGQYTKGIPLAAEAVHIAEIRHIQPVKLAGYLNDLALLYCDQGRYGEAEPLYQQALAMYQRLWGEEHPAVATSLNNLAGLYDNQGRYGEAEPLFQQALAMNQRLLGEERPAVASSLNNLAGLYDKQGRYREAESLYQQALAMNQRLWGEEHPAVASSLNNLAGLYDRQGRYGEAESLYQRALAMNQRLLGEEHPTVAQSLNNLAWLYDRQGRYGEAEPLYQQALAMKKRLLGEEHPAVATSLNNLAGLYYKQGRYGEAEPLLQQAVAMKKRLLGEEHPAVATSLNNLAALYDKQGRYGDAEPLYQQALAMNQRLLGEEHPAVATSLNNLASLYDNQGRYGEAELPYQQALTMRKRLLGKEHPDIASNLSNLGALYAKQGRYGEAEPLYQQALAMYQRLLGEEHPDVASSLSNLALLYDNQGRYGEAESLYQQALAMNQRLLGDEHPAVANSFNNLALLYDNQGRYGEAEPLYQQALAMNQRLLGDEHPAVANSLNNLGALYAKQGRYTDTEPLYQQALAIKKRLLGAEHPDIASSWFNLGTLRYKQGRYHDAQILLLQAQPIYHATLGPDHPNTQELQSWIDLVQTELDSQTE